MQSHTIRREEPCRFPFISNPPLLDKPKKKKPTKEKRYQRLPNRLLRILSPMPIFLALELFLLVWLLTGLLS